MFFVTIYILIRNVNKLTFALFFLMHHCPNDIQTKNNHIRLLRFLQQFKNL